ncbi:galactoside 2-alpha-L-fucosyltransferase 2-like isoform X2 [Mizuhopecten yessoensis]|nr:galactoside 2-alpha-L-fucosyltransferase 2-like isoform X2 [Mizuhopecten yessoensis]
MSLVMMIMRIILDRTSTHLSSKSNQRPNDTSSSRQSTVTTDSDIRKELENILKLCPSSVGRLGNQMFAYASTYGIARSVNRTMVISNDHILRNVFKLTAYVMPNRSFSCTRWKQVAPKFSGRFDGNIYNRVIGNKCDIMLIKYLQSWKYFEKYKSEILLEFSLKDELKVMADSILHQAAKSVSMDSEEGNTATYIGVHIRRGDLLFDSKVQFGYNVATGTYIKHSITYFLSKFSNPVFIVCSTTLDWAKEELRDLTNVYIKYVYTKNRPEVDFAVLVACNHTIMTVGTFGWWAGYLAGGDVIYYKYPVRNNSKLREQLDSSFSDYFPSHWIGMG